MFFFVDYNGEKTSDRIMFAGNKGDTLVLEYNLTDVRAERHGGWSGFVNPGQIKATAGSTNDVAFFNTL
jgi:hypothetical protein